MSPTISPAPASALSGGPGTASALAGNPAASYAADLGPAGEEALIPLLRNQIDAIDAGVARLIAERARLSSRIQAARIAAGGVRVELSRERRILDGYRSALGEDGVGLGTAVLRLCRGPL